MCACVCVYRYVYLHFQTKVFDHTQIFFVILKVLFLMKQVKHHNSFIYYTKYKSFWTALDTN